jgi:hypothetical protein
MKYDMITTSTIHLSQIFFITIEEECCPLLWSFLQTSSQQKTCFVEIIWPELLTLRSEPEREAVCNGKLNKEALYLSEVENSKRLSNLLQDEVNDESLLYWTASLQRTPKGKTHRMRYRNFRRFFFSNSLGVNKTQKNMNFSNSTNPVYSGTG